MSLTKEQLEFRRTGIGGSDVAAILGKSKYKSPLDVYLSKIEDSHENISNRYTEWGNKLEDVIADEYSNRTSKSLIKPKTDCREHLEEYRSKKYPFMIANFDRLIEGENAALEIKTTDKMLSVEWGEEGTDVIPDSYLLQVAHYRIVKNLDYVDIAVLIGGNDFRTYRYEKHSDLEGKIIDIETKFWNDHVVKLIPPTPTNYKEVGSLWPVSQEKSITADIETLQKVEELKQIQSRVKDLLTKEEEYKSHICNLLKDASVLLSPEGQALLTWKTQNANRFNMDSFREKYPDLYKEFLTTSQSRTFRIKK